MTVAELSAEWAVVAVRVAGGVCYCSSLIDQHCSLAVDRQRAMGNHYCKSQLVLLEHPLVPSEHRLFSELRLLSEFQLF